MTIIEWSNKLGLNNSVKYHGREQYGTIWK